MMYGVRGFWIAGAALALAGCQKPDNAPGPGGVSMGEARALDEAAKMLDARQPPPELSRPSLKQWPASQASGTATDPSAADTAVP
jgi:hypothetical protein